MIYDLPTSLEVSGEIYEIRSDYRYALDILIALNDPLLSDEQKNFLALYVLYPSFCPQDDTYVSMPVEHYDEAIKQCMWYLGGGSPIRKEVGIRKPKPKIMDWEHDFPFIVGPINYILKTEVRAEKYLHWWTFFAAYLEISTICGNCTFSQALNIRSKKAYGKKLDKSEQMWYRQNRDIVDFPIQYTREEEIVLESWIKSKSNAPA
jgi:hypothetical protein